MPRCLAPGGAEPRRPHGRAERRNAGTRRLGSRLSPGAVRCPHRGRRFQGQPLTLHPAQHDAQEQQRRQRPEEPVGHERGRHLQNAHRLLARRPGVGLLLRLGERGRVEERRERGVRVAAAHHHHGDHPDQHQRRRAGERPGQRARPDRRAHEQRAEPGRRRQGQDQQRVADREEGLRPDRVGREHAERAEGRDQHEPDPRRQGQHAGEAQRADVAAGEKSGQRDRRRQHHLVQAGRAVAHHDLREEPGPDEEQPDRLPANHQVDKVRAVARHVGRPEVAQVVRVQQHQHQVGDQPGERDGDERPLAAGAELVPGLAGGEAQGRHAITSSSRTPARAIAA